MAVQHTSTTTVMGSVSVMIAPMRLSVKVPGLTIYTLNGAPQVGKCQHDFLRKIDNRFPY